MDHTGPLPMDIHPTSGGFDLVVEHAHRMRPKLVADVIATMDGQRELVGVLLEKVRNRSLRLAPVPRDERDSG